MKFLIDAQLPPALKFVFLDRGYEAYHTLDLPRRNDTSDQEILVLAEKEKYVVITKDKDFYNSFILKRQPQKLILVRVGNIRIKDLKAIFENNFDKLLHLLNYKDLVIVGIDRIDITI
jgi:predicted nuclease of predicted toxin-antitoxin system